MRLIESSVEYIPQENGLEGIYEQIEKCGRTCYKSEDKITEDSAKGFVYRMIKSRHLSMTEHGTVYLKVDSYQNRDYPDIDNFYNYSPYSKVYNRPTIPRGAYLKYISTNFRVLIENNRLNDLKYLCNPTESHEKRYTFKFTTDRGVSHKRFVA